MPPKKKGKKRSSTESKEDGETNFEGATTDILSPSEVVKMRKKAQQQSSLASESLLATKEPSKEKDKSLSRKSKSISKSSKNLKDKAEGDKRKDKGRSHDQKKMKGMKEKRKSLKKGELEEGDKQLVLYPCGVCNNEVVDSDEAILCEAGCEFWYHRKCAGMTDIAYELLTKEDYAEWVCDKCISTKSVPLVKMKNPLEA